MQGIDIHPFYQRGINWKILGAQSNVEFVWVKVSDGAGPYAHVDHGITYVPDGQVYGARSVGLKVGGYHYAQMQPTPQQQANVLIGEVLRLTAIDIPPALDLEFPFQPGPTAESFAYQFLSHVKLSGFTQVALYAGPAIMDSVLSDRVKAIPGLVIWIAGEYPHPQFYNGPADVHQYSANGSVPGIAQPVDLDQTVSDVFDPKPVTPIQEAPKMIDGSIFYAKGDTNKDVYAVRVQFQSEAPLLRRIVTQQEWKIVQDSGHEVLTVMPQALFDTIPVLTHSV